MKKFFKNIISFLKLHKVISVIMCVVIFLCCLWTPVIVILNKQNQTEKPETSQNNEISENSGQSVFVFSQNSSPSTNKNFDETVTSSNSSEKKSTNSSKKATTEDSSEKKQTYNYATSSNTEENNQSVDPISPNAPKIICWGDSITFGMGMSRSQTYPAFLQNFVGNGYRVLNAGSSGERSHTIAARQGAYDVFLDKDIVFGKDYGNADIGTDGDHSMILSDGTKLDINKDGEAFMNDLPSKKVFIDGKEYELAVQDGKFELLRENYKKKLVLKKGSKVVFESAKTQENSYCGIFYIGANDGLSGTDADIEYLINRYKAMIKCQKNDRYLVIIPQWSAKFTKRFKTEFGDKAIDLRIEICKRDLSSVGIFATERDLEQMAQNTIPTSLKYNNNVADSLHFNEYGYEIMASIIYERGVKLGYWK